MLNEELSNQHKIRTRKIALLAATGLCGPCLLRRYSCQADAMGVCPRAPSPRVLKTLMSLAPWLPFTLQICLWGVRFFLWTRYKPVLSFLIIPTFQAPGDYILAPGHLAWKWVRLSRISPTAHLSLLWPSQSFSAHVDSSLFPPQRATEFPSSKLPVI